MGYLDFSQQQRIVSGTKLNQYSSRSHSILILEVTQTLQKQNISKKGTLNLVDLAGSEKVSKTGAVGETLEEAKKINLSLSALGNVIHALTGNSDRYHVPYRDSKLTRILQESLGGNYKTSLIVTCSPHSYHLEESVSSLKFAQRAKSIKNTAKMNIKLSYEELQKINNNLKLELELTNLELISMKNIINENKLLSNLNKKKKTNPIKIQTAQIKDNNNINSSLEIDINKSHENIISEMKENKVEEDYNINCKDHIILIEQLNLKIANLTNELTEKNENISNLNLKIKEYKQNEELLSNFNLCSNLNNISNKLKDLENIKSEVQVSNNNFNNLNNITEAEILTGDIKVNLYFNKILFLFLKENFIERKQLFDLLNYKEIDLNNDSILNSNRKQDDDNVKVPVSLLKGLISQSFLTEADKCLVNYFNNKLKKCESQNLIMVDIIEYLIKVNLDLNDKLQKQEIKENYITSVIPSFIDNKNIIKNSSIEEYNSVIVNTDNNNSISNNNNNNEEMINKLDENIRLINKIKLKTSNSKIVKFISKKNTEVLKNINSNNNNNINLISTFDPNNTSNDCTPRTFKHNNICKSSFVAHPTSGFKRTFINNTETNFNIQKLNVLKDFLVKTVKDSEVVKEKFNTIRSELASFVSKTNNNYKNIDTKAYMCEDIISPLISARESSNYLDENNNNNNNNNLSSNVSPSLSNSAKIKRNINNYNNISFLSTSRVFKSVDEAMIIDKYVNTATATRKLNGVYFTYENNNSMKCVYDGGLNAKNKLNIRILEEHILNNPGDNSVTLDDSLLNTTTNN